MGDVLPGGVAQWIGRHPATQKVAGSILYLGTCLGYGPSPRLENTQEAMDVFLPPLLSLKINKVRGHLSSSFTILAKSQSPLSYLEQWVAN